MNPGQIEFISDMVGDIEDLRLILLDIVRELSSGQLHKARLVALEEKLIRIGDRKISRLKTMAAGL